MILKLTISLLLAIIIICLWFKSASNGEKIDSLEGWNDEKQNKAA